MNHGFSFDALWTPVTDATSATHPANVSTDPAFNATSPSPRVDSRLLLPRELLPNESNHLEMAVLAGSASQDASQDASSEPTTEDGVQHTAYDSVWSETSIPIQESSGIERQLLKEDKLYAVLAVVLIIWIGIAYFIMRTDRKLDRLERRVDTDSNS